MSYPPLALVSLLLLAPELAVGQTVVNSVFTPNGAASYGDIANWSPPEIPNNSAEKSYHVTIPGFVRLDVDATISELTPSGYFGAADHSLIVTGNAALSDFHLAIASTSAAGATFSAGSLSSFSSGTLTGNYDLSNYNTGTGWATLKFNGADITTLSAASLFLAGPLTRIVDEFDNDALRNLAHIESDSNLGMVGRQLTVVGPFTNDGQLNIAAGFNQASHFSVVGILTNFDPNSRTLTGGTYYVGGSSSAGSNEPTVFQFGGADIVHNAATIGISGSLARITDQNGSDALRNFAHNTATGTFSVSDRDYLIAGDFTNDGVVSLALGTLRVKGSLNNFDPATRTLTGGSYQLDGNAGPVSLIFSGADIVNNAALIYLNDGARIVDENGNDGLRNFAHNLAGGEFTIRGDAFAPASNFTNAGVMNILGHPPTNGSQPNFQLAENHVYEQTAGSTYFASTIFNGDMVISGGSFTTAGTNAFFAPESRLNGDLTVGDALFGPVYFTVNGAVHLSGSSRFSTGLQGPNVGFFSVMGTFTAGGTLEINATGFPPPSTASFPVVGAAGGVTGTFSNAPNGARIPTSNGLGSFVVTYTPNAISISDFQAIPLPAQLLNISARVQVLTGDNAPIGGFIVFGRDPKKVIIRGLGPSLSASGVGGALQDPTLELHGPTGVTINNNWRDSQAAEIQTNGLAPTDDRESAIVATLAPGAYTAILRGTNNTTGAGLVEVYDLAQETKSKLANISTRGFVDPDNLIIGGMIVGGSGQGSAALVVRALGPKLSSAHVPGFLPDPTVELRNSQGSLVAFNDDCGDSPENFQGIPPELYLFNSKDAALPATVPPGGYTAIVRGKAGASGIAVVEIYDLNH